jgi:hypothetical protein
MQGGPAYGQAGPGYGQGGPGYGQGGPGYGQVDPNYGQPRPQGTNGLAIAALIFGITPLFLLGFIFGFISLSKIKKTGQAGRGLAIAGVILSALWMVAWVVGTIVIVSAVKTVLNNNGAPGFGLTPGDCFNQNTTNAAQPIDKLACTTAHDGETVALLPITGTTYPGEQAMSQQANDQCVTATKSYLDPAMDYPNLTPAYLAPSALAWAAGNHSIVCYVSSTTGKLNTPARGTGTPAQH